MYSNSKSRLMSHWVWMNRSNNSKGNRTKKRNRTIHHLTNICSRPHITRLNVSKMIGNRITIMVISTKSNNKIKSNMKNIRSNKIKMGKNMKINNRNSPHMSHWVYKTTPLLMTNNNNPTPINCNSRMKTNTNNNLSKTKIKINITNTKNSNRQMDMSLSNLIDLLVM